MVRRNSDDRRVTKIKVDVDSRQISRRHEDLANIRAYYIVLGISIFILVLTGVLTFMWGESNVF